MNNKQQQESPLSSHRREELKGWLKATPAERLAWLEEALTIAYQSGALPKKQGAPPHKDHEG